jgi:hypothetical protein
MLSKPCQPRALHEVPDAKIPKKVGFAVLDESFTKLLLLGTTIALFAIHGRVASLLGNSSVLPKRRKIS